MSCFGNSVGFGRSASAIPVVFDRSAHKHLVVCCACPCATVGGSQPLVQGLAHIVRIRRGALGSQCRDYVACPCIHRGLREHTATFRSLAYACAGRASLASHEATHWGPGPGLVCAIWRMWYGACRAGVSAAQPDQSQRGGVVIPAGSSTKLRLRVVDLLVCQPPFRHE